MDLKTKIQKLNDGAASIRELTRGLNMRAAALSGVAAVIPDDAPSPACYFKGCKVILKGVSYDGLAGGICATLNLPPTDRNNEGNLFSGGRYRFHITEDWFK